jgi:hypothetical protein
MRSGFVVLAAVLTLGLALGLASCSNEEAELAEKAKQEQSSLDQALAAYNSGDFGTALNRLRPLAEAGNTVAQNNLGRMYYDGTGVAENDAEAVKWFQLAAEKGQPTAQFNLGAAYEYGNGVRRTSNRRSAGTERRRSRAGPRPRSILAGCTTKDWGWRRTRSRRYAGSTSPPCRDYGRRSSISACSTAQGALRPRTMPRR